MSKTAPGLMTSRMIRLMEGWQVLAHGRGSAEHVHLGGEHAAHIQGDAVRNPHERQVTAGAHAAERLVESYLVAHRFDDAVGPQAARSVP